jgi:hypothetical protein
MGLEKSKDKFGVTFANAYTRINQVRTSQALGSDGVTKIINAEIIVQIYPDQTARNNGDPSMETQRLNTTMDKSSTDNFYSQSYTYLKTLPEWTGATDITGDE